MAKKLKTIGIHETERDIADKISRGFYSFVFGPMSHRYWLRYITALTLQLLALAVAGQLVFGIWSTYQVNRDRYRDYQKRDGEDQKKTADEIAKRCGAIAQANPALKDCVREAIAGYQKKQHDDRDLQAQQDMAFWALISAAVSGVGVFVSIVGLGFIWQSLRQTRLAITNDREIGEAQVRAYLTVVTPDQNSPEIHPQRPIRAELKIKNTGQSPAYNVRYIATLMPLQYPLPDNQGDLIEPDPASIQQGVTVGADADIRIEAELTEGVSAQDIISIKSEGPLRLFAVVIITYFDVFKRQERKTKYCAYLTKGIPIVDPQNRKVGTKHEWALANVHNEAT